MPPRGFEPLILSEQRPKRCAYSSSATGASYPNYALLEAKKEEARRLMSYDTNPPGLDLVYELFKR